MFSENIISDIAAEIIETAAYHTEDIGHEN
ncbi:hypothetical protein clg_43 [Corynebacterium phage CL31]|nr:hypothetical protein clg_43 [Corynebacterium phage CL31]